MAATAKKKASKKKSMSQKPARRPVKQVSSTAKSRQPQ